METCAILAINSLNRYTVGTGLGQPSLDGVALLSQFNIEGQPCNDFTIFTAGALIYGYIKKIQISQTQMQYNIPTVIPNRNDSFYFEFEADYYHITIPFGFYTPQELAPVLELEIRNASPIDGPIGANPDLADFTVTYSALNFGFTFKTNNQFDFGFVTLESFLEFSSPNEVATLLRTYKLLGMDLSNTGGGTNTQVSNNTPVFLYTPYIDIVSPTLTKYQKVKDTDSSPQKQADIISRIYLAGTGGPQITAGDINVYPLGSRPFTVVQDMNYCKTLRWSKDEAVNSLNFKLKDQYGELIYQGDSTSNFVYYTEFQMTLLCIEDQD